MPSECLSSVGVQLGGESNQTTPEPKTRAAHDTHYLKSREFGVWRILFELPNVSPFWTRNPLSSLDVRPHVAKFKQDFPFIVRFVKECFQLAPWSAFLWMIAQVFSSLMPAIVLSCSGRLLEVIQTTIEERAGDRAAFYQAAVALVGARLLSQQFSHVTARLNTIVSDRITKHFDIYIVQVYLRLDVPTFEDNVTSAIIGDLSSDHAPWLIVENTISIITTLIRIISELLVLISLLRTENGGVLFGFVTCLSPLLAIIQPGWRAEAFYFHTINPHYTRMERMRRLAHDSEYRSHIIGDGLEDYIHSEFRASIDALGDTDLGSPWREITKRNQGMRVLHSVLEDLPMIVFAAQALSSPGAIPLKSLTLLRSVTQNIAGMIQLLTQRIGAITEHRKSTRQLYESMKIKNIVVDGEIPYPRPVDKSDASRGMEIEFRNVNFKYPHDEKKEDVLNNVSFRIQPGQLCVIVGENGCGKSTTIKLLSRLFDITEGEILVDGLPIQSYQAKDLRRAEAMLYQEFVHYPLTVRENIGLGSVEHSADIERIRRAAQLAGAQDFIEALPRGFETQMIDDFHSLSSLGDSQPDGPLQEYIKNLDSGLNLSGGQWQRLAIAKTFMRVGEDDQVRLLCFDEPSSALDPKAEFDLFEKLRSMRGRKSLIFVTHRFGHLTKHADQILYMKKGVIIEKGTHDELLAQDGAYAHLYNVQAQAFSTKV